jgi:hypothetical protein
MTWAIVPLNNTIASYVRERARGARGSNLVFELLSPSCKMIPIGSLFSDPKEKNDGPILVLHYRGNKILL